MNAAERDEACDLARILRTILMHKEIRPAINEDAKQQTIDRCEKLMAESPRVAAPPRGPSPLAEILASLAYLSIEDRGRLRYALATQSPKVATVKQPSE